MTQCIRFRSVPWLTAMAAAVVMMPSHAEVNLNGFATITTGLTGSGESLYGYDDDLSFEPNSLVGIQASSELGNKLSATVQLLSKGEDDWDVTAEWAYLSYDVNDYTKILAGKQRVPFYMYSAYVDVGYAYHWIRPPEGVYSLPFDSLTGLGVIYSKPLGKIDSTAQLLVGRTTEDITFGGIDRDSEIANLVSFAWDLTYEWFTFHVGYTQADVSIDINDIDQLTAGWEAAGFPQLSSELSIEEEGMTFSNVGFSVDYDNVLITGEWTELDTGDSFLSVNESAYISAGYRIGSIMPHITYGTSEGDTNPSPFAAVPYGIDPGLDALRFGSESLVSSQAVDSSYITAGVRWNFHNSASIKAEYTEFSDDITSSSDAGLFRLSVTTVF